MIIEKLSYTNGEKVAEIISGIVTIGAVGGYITLFSLGKISGNTPILIVCSLILYAVLTFCSVCPQHANIFTHPEKYSENTFRVTRRVCLALKIAFCAGLCVFPLIGIETHN